jgi:hypothetical protein
MFFTKTYATFTLMITLITAQTKIRAMPKPFTSHSLHLIFHEPWGIKKKVSK